MAHRIGDVPRNQGSRVSGRTAQIVAALVLATGLSRAIASTQSGSGPVASVSGARTLGAIPAESNCTRCHHTLIGINENTPGGAVEILDLPETYESDTVYGPRIRLHSDSTASAPGRRWGFQLTAVRESDGTGVGTFVLPPGDSMQIVPGVGPYASRSYVEHAFIGTRIGLGGPVEWALSWQAPASPSGKILFFVAGNAADGSFEPSGDFIFTSADSMADIKTPVLPRTWGALKRRYR